MAIRAWRWSGGGVGWLGLLGRLGLALGALALLAWTLVPFYWLVVRSVLTKSEQLEPTSALFPRAPDASQFVALLEFRLFPPGGGLLAPGPENWAQLNGWVNSLLVASVVVPLTLVAAVPAAYAFGRLRFRHRTALLAILVLARFTPPISIAVPLAFMFQSLAINGTLSGVILAHLSLSIPLVAWLMTGFFAVLPRSLEAAARIDGLTRVGVLLQVTLRMALPGLAACAAVAFLTSWNEYFLAQVVTSGTPAQTAPLTARSSAPAFILLTLIPPLALALLLQRALRSVSIVSPL